MSKVNVLKAVMPAGVGSLHITQREQHVLALLRQGESSRTIASILDISFNTVETHRKKLLQKFDVKNTPELIDKASLKMNWTLEAMKAGMDEKNGVIKQRKLE